MNDENWRRYTMTAIVGLIAGIVTTFTGMTISNTSRIAAMENEQQNIRNTLTRIENKLDQAFQRK